MKHVLIIDDDPNNIFALKATLKSRGWKVESAGGAEEGIKILENEPSIGILLLDMMMPDIDGYEAINMIRGNAQLGDLAIVAVTAQAMPGDKERCLAAGADDYISKPIDVDKLVTILDRG